MTKHVILILTIAIGLTGVTLLSRSIDARRTNVSMEFAEEALYVNGPTAKRMSLAFNGLAADWYWMRSLQYVGRKIIHYQDTHMGQFNLSSLGELDLRLLPSLLRMSTTLDPQFMEPFYYGAVILPEIDRQEAIALLDEGVAANPNQWRLRQHLGYIYWQQHDYQKAAEVYAAGAKLPDAPDWMAAMSARMKAQGGAPQAAREMYTRLYEASDDPYIRRMVEHQLMRLDSLDQMELIRRLLTEYSTRTRQCPASWKEITVRLRNSGLRVDSAGAPLDPGNVPYSLIKNGCDVGLGEKSVVPRF
jgi:tetratricopeptide (TPR) repeat protein